MLNSYYHIEQGGAGGVIDRPHKYKKELHMRLQGKTAFVTGAAGTTVRINGGLQRRYQAQ